MALRIAMVCSQGPPVYGGAGTQALGLARTLLRHDVTVDYFTQNQLRVEREEQVEPGLRILRAPGEGLAAKLPQRPAQVVRSASFLIWLFFRLLLGRYDVLHLHGSYWFGLPAAIVGRLRRRPVIVKVTRLGEDDAGTVAAKQIKGVPLGKLYGYAFAHASLAIALSREIEDRHHQAYPGRRVKLLPNGVDVARFQAARASRAAKRAELGFTDDSFVVLFVGYLAPHKGVTLLLDAWRQTAQSPDDHLLLVGPSGGFYRELDDAVSARARGEASVQVLDHVEFAEMPAIYAAADVFVLPTKAEGMPNSLLEALAAGLPSVVSKVPGVVEIAEEAQGVILADPLTVEELAASLNAARVPAATGDRDPKLPMHFGLDHVAGVYAGLYDELTR